ncbi:MAG: hypothetical protein C0601_05390 [Candidatus Muiribacterium halophilum]|uniref:Ion-translocating oxidoreductase complex subunit G n=1 Tax=Muiribacterium halophilum TaxID=2053465 RepID=A0A2N5ZHU7_MUIH1|nr:MAG: hypothetical protein C0601_05390 [Candidatus Muirbacterium halophilum]
MNIVKLGVILMIFCIVAAASLSYVNQLTAGEIQKNREQREMIAKRNLFIGDTLDLTIFSDGEYKAVNPETGEDILLFEFKNTAILKPEVDLGYFKIAKKEVEEVVKKINDEQLLDTTKVNEKLMPFYKALMEAFSSQIKFLPQTVVVGVFGTNLLITEENLPLYKALYKGSAIYFVDAEDKADTLLLEKVDQTYRKEIIKTGSILFNQNQSLEFDGQVEFPVFHYDKAMAGNQFLGYVIKAAPSGYSSNIETLIGLDGHGKIIGLKVVSQQETPGLGAKVQEDWFQDQFKGKDINSLYLRKKDPKKGKIDAITAATISSEALTKGVREKLTSFMTLIKEGGR